MKNLDALCTRQKTWLFSIYTFEKKENWKTQKLTKRYTFTKCF